MSRRSYNALDATDEPRVIPATSFTNELKNVTHTRTLLAIAITELSTDLTNPQPDLTLVNTIKKYILRSETEIALENT